MAPESVTFLLTSQVLAAIGIGNSQIKKQFKIVLLIGTDETVDKYVFNAATTTNYINHKRPGVTSIRKYFNKIIQ